MKNFIKLFCFIILLLTIVSRTEANTYYVSPTGNDNNNGLSTAQAWQTINKINSSQFSAGDVVSFEGGATFNGSIYSPGLANGITGNPITLTSYGTGKATINSLLEEGIFVNHGNLIISNLIFKGSGYKLSGLYTAGIDFYIDSLATVNIDNVIVDNVECYGYGYWGILMATYSPDHGYNHVRITNCLFHDNGYGGLIIEGYATDTSVTFSNSDIYIGYTKVYNNLGRSDFLDNWSGTGILLAGTVNGLIEYCEAYNNGKENGSLTAGPVGIFLSDSKFVTIQHSSSHHNLGGKYKHDGGGFDLDQGTYGCVIQYCESYENEGAGYGIYQAPTTNSWSNDTVRYNKSTNDGRNYDVYGAFTFWGASGSYKINKAEIYGNQISMSKPGYGLIFLNNNLLDVNISDNTFCLEGQASYLKNAIPSSVNVINSSFPCSVQPPAIIPVTFRGAFAPPPSDMWTDTWTNYNTQSAAYPVPDSIIQTAITTNTILSGSKSYRLTGLIYVKNGAVLTIQPGCVIMGDKATPNSSLIIAQGSKIIAAGTPTKPIVFTSSQPAGSRNRGDWGGLVLLGNAHYNGAGGQSRLLDASSETQFGGGATPDDEDNSGILQYVRIEYGGNAQAVAQGIKAFTLAAVGSRTIIERVQVSYSNTDGFDWRGGSVNCRYLVSYRNLDDNWSTSNGYNGAVQFGLGLSDPAVADGSTSNGFDSENDASGSSTTSFTSPLFCNITEIGPLRGNPAASIPATYGRNAHFRNNTHLRIVNSILMDFPTGVFIDGQSCSQLAIESFISTSPNKSPGNLVFKNNLVAGTRPGKVLEKNTNWNMSEWFAANRNDSLTQTTNILINPYRISGNAFAGDYRPATASPARNNYNWNDSTFYAFDSVGNKINLITCPVTVPVPATIVGATNACSYISSGEAAIYYLSEKSNGGILRYNWTVPNGASIQSGQGTDTLVVKFTNAFAGGIISARNVTYCGVSSSSKNFALPNNSITPLKADTTLYIVCPNEKVNLTPLYSATGYASANWNTASPETVAAGNYQFIVSNTAGCKDTATAFVKQDIAVWQGTVSKSWHNAANWSNGHIPTEKTHVIIKGSTPNLCEVSDTDAVCASLQATNSGTISFINGRKLVIYGKCDPLPAAP